MTMRWGTGRALDRPILPIRPRPDCVPEPYYRGVSGTRWWRCSCGQVIHRHRPKPYPPVHA